MPLYHAYSAWSEPTSAGDAQLAALAWGAFSSGECAPGPIVAMDSCWIHSGDRSSAFAAAAVSDALWPLCAWSRASPAPTPRTPPSPRAWWPRDPAIGGEKSAARRASSFSS